MLYDEFDRPFNASATLVAWKGGASDDRRTRAWQASDASINALLSGEVGELRRRTRDLFRKNPWAENGLSAWVSNLVGTGLVPRPLIKDEKLRNRVMDAWEEFTENSDSDGTQDFYGQQALVARSYKEGGDCFVRLRDRRKGELPIPLQLQVVEAEFVDPSYNQTFGGARKIQAGIEFDGLGKRAAYHMWQDHPGEMVSLRNATRVRVPAQSVLHVFHPVRPGQIRGIPVLAAVLAKLWELEKYDDAEVMRKQVAAMFAGFLQKPDGSANPLDANGAEGKDKDGTPLAALEPGTIQELGPGEQIVFSEPSDVGASYSPFMAFQLRQVAAAIGVTYEQLTGDLSGVNYSSIRAGIIEMRRRLAQVQRNVLIFQFCRPVYRRFMEAAVLVGRIPVPASFRDLLRVQWVLTPGWEYVDPDKEISAAIKAIRAGLTTRGREVTARGADVVALDEETAADNERADRLGLVFDTDPRRTNAGGQLAMQSHAPGGAPDPGDDEEPDDGEGEEDEDEETAPPAPPVEEEARLDATSQAGRGAAHARRKRADRRTAAVGAGGDGAPDLPDRPRARKRPGPAASDVRHLRGPDGEPGPGRRNRDRPSRR